MTTISTTARTVAAAFAAALLSLSLTGAAQAQVRTHVIGNTMQQPNPELLKQMKAAQDQRVSLRKKGFKQATQKILNGKSAAGKLVRDKGNAARQIRQNAKMRQMFKQKLTKAPMGILKRPGAPSANKHVKFNKKPLGKGPQYRAKHIAKKNVRFPGKSAKTLKKAKNMRNASKAAKTARAARNVHKASKAAKLAIAGTGVGAVATIGAGMAGLDPVEMATLKATNPAEYNRRMRDLKKNPVKYVGKNIANNTKKAAQNVGKAGKKVGCGIGNVFKKKENEKKC